MAKQYEVGIIVKADGTGLTGAFKSLEQSVDRLAGKLGEVPPAARKVGQELTNAGNAAEGKTRKLRDLFGGLGTLKGLLATTGISLFAAQVFTATNAIDGWRSAFLAITGSQSASAAALQFVNVQADRLGQSVAALAPAYVSLSAATRTSNLAGEQTRQIFLAVAEAGSVLRLSNEQVTGALQAIQQIVSKGTVSMEELRGQLAERIPGAFQLAARAIGVTEKELVKLVSSGTVTAEQLLPKLAQELRIFAAAGLDASAKSPAAEFNRLSNAFREFLAALGNAGAIDLAISAFRALTTVLQTLSENIEVFQGVVVLVAGVLAGRYVAAVLVARVAARALAAEQLALAGASVVATAGLTATAAAAGVARLALGLLGGPIGLIITGIASLPLLFSLFGDSVDKSAAQTKTATQALRDYNNARAQLSDEKATPGGIATVKPADLFNDALKEREQLVKKVDALEQQAADKYRQRYSGLVQIDQLRQGQITIYQRAIAQTDLQLAKLTATQDNYGGAALRAFKIAAENAFSLEAGITAAVVALQELLTKTADPALGALGKDLKKELDSARESLQRAQGKNPLLEELKSLDVVYSRLSDSQKKLVDSYRLLATEITDTEAQTRSLTEAEQRNTQAMQTAKQNTDASARSLEQLNRITRDLNATFSGPSAQALEQYADTIGEIGRLRAELGRDGQGAGDQQAVRDALLASDTVYLQRQVQIIAAEKQRADAFAQFKAQMFQDLQREASLAGATAQAREALVRQYEAEDLVLRLLDAANRAGITISDKKLAQLRAEITLRKEMSAELEREAQRREALGSFGVAEQPDGQFQSLNSLPELIGASIDAAMRDGASGFRKVLSSFLEGFEKAVQEKGAVAATADVVTAAANFLGNARQAFRDNRDAPLNAIVQIAAQIPGRIGAVAQAIGAINALFDGKLLGTNFQNSGSRIGVSVGASGVSGQQLTDQTRQRAFFGGTARRTLTTNLDDSTLNGFKEIVAQTRIAIATVARELGQTVPTTLAAEFKQTFDKDGKLVSQISDVLGEKFNESAEQFAKRYLAEGLLQVIEQAAPGVRALTDAFRIDASKLLDFAQGVVAISTALQAGNGLLGASASILDTTQFVVGQQRAGEALSTTFERLQQATASLDAAMLITGVNLGLTRQEFVAFASEIADAAGGVQQASALWQNYFETFYDAEERATKSLANAVTARNAALTAVGLETTITAQQFRAQFEAALPTLTPEQIVQYLRAGAAIGAVITAESELADIREQATQALTESTQQLAQALAAYGSLSTNLAQQLQDFDSTPLQRSINEIERWRNQQIAAFTDAARAAGLQGIAEEDLSRIHLLAAARISQAIGQIEAAGRDRVSRLRQLLRDQSQAGNQATLSGNSEVSQAVDDRYKAELDFLKQLERFVDSLNFSAQSTLTPEQQFNSAENSFLDILRRAQGGDALAQQQLQSAAQQYLQSAQSFLGVSARYDAIFASVTGALRQLIASGPQGQSAQSGGENMFGPSRIGFGGGGLVLEDPSIQQARAERIALVQEILDLAAQIISATGQSLNEVSATFGITGRELISALGINIGSATLETTLQLADISRRLGIDLTALASDVGFNLGALASRQSLLNQALANVIDELPADQAASLRPLFDAVTNATSDADANAALVVLEAAVNGLAPDIRNQLAPFFTGVKPVEQSQLDALSGISTGISGLRTVASEGNSILRNILTALRPPPGAPPPAIAPAQGFGTPAAGTSASTPNASTSNNRSAQQQEQIDAQLRANAAQNQRNTDAINRLIVGQDAQTRLFRELVEVMR